MTSISAVQPINIPSIQPVAVQILQQAEEAQAEAAEKEKPDDLVEVANGMSGEPSEVAAKSLFLVNAAFIKMTEKSQFMAEVVEFINSDQFKMTDPLGKGVLKRVLSEQGWEFMQLVNQQYDMYGGMSREGLYALTLPRIIMKNRELFDAEEFEVGVKFKDKTGIIFMIPDVEGNSTFRDLTKAMKQELVIAQKTDDFEVVVQLQDEFGRFRASMNKVFDYDPKEDGGTMLDIDVLNDPPWVTKRQ